MNILFVNHLLDPVSGGGTAERTFQLLRFLTFAGERCSLLTLDIGLTPARLAGLGAVRTHVVPCLNSRFFLPKISAVEVHHLVAEADVVQLSGHWTLLNAMVYRACRRLSKPYLFCPAGALKLFGRSQFMKRVYDCLVGGSIVRDAARCVAITNDECADFTARGVPPDRLMVIPNGIDPDLYVLDDPARAEAAFRQVQGLGNAPYVLFLGRLNDIKGPDLLLEAFCTIADRFPDLQLVFAGPDGGLLAGLRANAARRGLSARVRFAGFVGGATKAAALRSARILAIPSRREAMSIVVLEAGVCGCPVLFTDTCGLAGLADAGAGTQVAPAAADIASGLGRMLDDPAALARSGGRLAEVVSADYLWQIQARRYAELCRTVVEQGTA